MSKYLKNNKFSIFLKLGVLISILLFHVLLQAEIVMNEVLFSIANESSTSRDRLVYQRVLNEVFKKDTISQFTPKTADDFLLSRLSYKEAKAFDMHGNEMKINENSKKKLISEFTQSEVERELEVISTALALIEIKEAQLKGKERFDTWFELIKHKYQLKIKSSETSDIKKIE